MIFDFLGQVPESLQNSCQLSPEVCPFLGPHCDEIVQCFIKGWQKGLKRFLDV